MFFFEDKNCKFCGSSMVIDEEWGDGYFEPKERADFCPNCGATYHQHEMAGKYWILNGKEFLDE